MTIDKTTDTSFLVTSNEEYKVSAGHWEIVPQGGANFSVAKKTVGLDGDVTAFVTYITGSSVPVMIFVNQNQEIKVTVSGGSVVLVKINGVQGNYPTFTTASGGGGGGGSTIDRELVVTTYRCRTAFTGASVGDTITSTQVIDVTSFPSTVSVIWRNQSTNADLASAPLAANIEIVGASALTDAQLRASAVAVSAASLPLPTGASTAALQGTTNTSLASIDGKLPTLVTGRVPVDGSGVTQPISAASLPLPSGAATSAAQTTINTSITTVNTSITSVNTALGAIADAAATTDTGSFSLLAFIKRGLTNWTTLLARIPTLVSGRMPVDGSGVTQPISAASLPLPTGASTAALQTTGNTSLSSIDGKLPSLSSGRVPVLSSIPTVTSGTILSLTTNATGTTYTAFASQVCTALDIVNNTGVTIEYRRGAAGIAMQIPNGAARMVIGITNANQIDVRRTDTSNITVTIQAEAFVG